VTAHGYSVCEETNLLFSYSFLYHSLPLIMLHSFMFQSSRVRNSLLVSSSRMADTELDLWNLINKDLKKENIIDANQCGFRKMNHVKVT